MIERALRWTAITIAVLGVVDPAMTVSGRTRPLLGLVVQTGPSMELPSASGAASRREAAQAVAARLHADLRDAFDIVEGFDRTAAATVLIGDRYPDDPVPETATVSTVTVAAPLTPDVRIAGVDAPRAVPPATAVRLGVVVQGQGLAGKTSDIVVRSHGAELARASHVWPASGDSWRADLEVVPIGEPPFTFDIATTEIPGERTFADNHATVQIDRAPRLRVLVLEGRPSWAAAFVRRELEDDPRFEVEGLSYAAPGVPVRSGGASGSRGLEGFDVVLVGGLDRVSASDITRLDRFLRLRGGSVAILPDSKVSTAVVRELLPGVAVRETLLDRPAALAAATALPRIDASELLEATNLPPGAVVLAQASGSREPVIWTVAVGFGRVLFSGALDAWRYRANPEVDFGRFWRSVVSGLALAAPPPIDVDLVPRRAALGQRVRVVARVRPLEQDSLRDRLAVSASVGADRPIRLWPDAAKGVFTGSFIVESSMTGQSPIVTVSAGDGTARGSARVILDRHPREEGGEPLSLLAETRRGIDVRPDDLAKLESHVRTAVPPQRVPVERHPMRSAWWIVPFAACLSCEWWLRRRTGDR